jgi:hypothetical protein
MNVRDSFKVNGVQYRLQTRKCGKPGCKCNTPGQEHGPYWYSYDGNSAAKYVGAQLPEHVKKHLELLKASGSKLKALKAEIKKRRDEHYREYSKASDEMRAVESLEAGEHVDSQVLKSLGLAQFNGHGKG